MRNDRADLTKAGVEPLSSLERLLVLIPSMEARASYAPPTGAPLPQAPIS